MCRNRVHYRVFSCVSVVVFSPTLIAQTVELRVVQVNDVLITPTDKFRVRPGDSFTVEATVTGEGITGALSAFQIRLVYAEERCPGYPFDPIYPRGLPTRPPSGITRDDCVEQVPECRGGSCVRPCGVDGYIFVISGGSL